MANLYTVTISTSANRVLNIVANSPEEAQAKAAPAEGEVVASVEDKGEVLV